jgi:glycosyltransferase involved in cell wall biosynthesis
LVLLGDGPERERLERRASSLEEVTFAGFQQYDTLSAYYALAGAFVHTALVEPWGLVVNEALASGTPALCSSHVGAATDLIVDGVTGFRFDPYSVEALTARLIEMAERPETDRKRMGQAGQKRVERWSPECFADGLWDAVETGHARSKRRISAAARGLLWAQRTVSRRSDSFHSIRD